MPTVTAPAALVTSLVKGCSPIIALGGAALARDLMAGRITSEQLMLPAMVQYFPNAAIAWKEWQAR